MNWIEEVVYVLKSVQREADIVLDEGWSGFKPAKNEYARFVTERMAEALAAIPDEPEMVKLLGWLKEQQTSMAMHYLEGGGVMEIIVGHIEEMGYKLADE